MSKQKLHWTLGFSILVVLVGFTLLLIAPYLIFSPLLNVIEIAYETVEGGKELKLQASSNMLIYIYPIMNDLVMIAGAILLMLAGPIYKENVLAKSFAIGALAVVAIFGAFIIETIALISGEHVIYGLILLLLGLLPSLIILFYHHFYNINKLLKLLLFVMIIISTGGNLFGTYEAFIDKYISVEILAEQIHLAKYTGMYSTLFGALLAMIGIPILAARSLKGLWLVSLAMLIMFIGSGNLWLSNPYHPHMALYLPVTILPVITLLFMVSLLTKKGEN